MKMNWKWAWRFTRSASSSPASIPEVRAQIDKILGRRLMLSASTSALGYGTQAFLLRNVMSVSRLLAWVTLISVFEAMNFVSGYFIQSEGLTGRSRTMAYTTLTIGLAGVGFVWGNIVLTPQIAANPALLLFHTMALAIVAIMAVHNLHLHKYGLALFHLGLSSGLICGAFLLRATPVDLGIAAMTLTAICQIYGSSSRRMTHDLLTSNFINRRIAAELKTTNERLGHLAAELHQAASTDPLTGCLNRRAMMVEIERAAATCKRNPSLSMSLVLLDIDHFKAINDHWGHEAGDTVLMALSNVLRDNTREGDAVGRWGGEEFLCLLVDTNVEQGMLAAEKLRRSVAQASISVADAEIAVTASFGVIGYDCDQPISELIAAADQHLYAAKSSGRNRVVGPRRHAEFRP